MDFFLRYDINFFSALLLVFFFFTIRLKGEPTGTSNRLFFRLLWAAVFMLLLEVASWAYDGIPGKNNLNYFFNFFLALLTSSITCFLASYIDYHMFGSYERLRKKWFYCQPFILAGILVIINIFHPVLFSISPDNIYRRESLMIMIPAINVGMYLYIVSMAYRNRQRINREIIWVLLLYALMPALAAFGQVLFFGPLIIWPTIAATLILTYTFLESVSTSRDYLTGLMNRQRIDSHLEYLINRQKEFILIIIDLNNFKAINDRHGHIQGDTALQVFSESLRRHFREAKVVGRYAGDEFMIITENMDRKDTEDRLKNIRREMKQLEEKGKMDFNVDFSYGCYEHLANDNSSYEEIINVADQKMYYYKMAKREKNGIDAKGSG